MASSQRLQSGRFLASRRSRGSSASASLVSATRAYSAPPGSSPSSGTSMIVTERLGTCRPTGTEGSPGLTDVTPSPDNKSRAYRDGLRSRCGR
ncbi:hypothetical protein NEOLEDRAFT_1133926 [Neolentinus lepideus HHB14362 ss-1]|uniref:Uncharacterized protein n=1 Tax=Neolentinus lepideus HHB14362 ss-1 TaxID=1314782 RepID=A0A165SHE7_9AGAM|nr:hypothetical protein NEOLEDRAFT_1133926 [Neolentinus lepideus HHB14362 ss-1]